MADLIGPCFVTRHVAGFLLSCERKTIFTGQVLFLIEAVPRDGPCWSHSSAKGHGHSSVKGHRQPLLQGSVLPGLQSSLVGWPGAFSIPSLL